MRALRDIVAAPYARHVVAKYTTAGTYSLTLAPGKYHIVIVGPGGGAATAGYTTERGASEAVGNLGYATGGGGGLISGDVVFPATTQATIVVASGGVGSGMEGIGDSAGSRFASGKSGEATSFSFDSNIGDATSGNVDGYALAQVSNVGSQTLRPGASGKSKHMFPGMTTLLYGNTGSIPETAITSIAEGTSRVVQGGLAGSGYSPAELGDAGMGGDVTYGYVGGVLTFNGGNGRDGGVLIERIG